jgi:hypothetical protein
MPSEGFSPGNLRDNAVCAQSVFHSNVALYCRFSFQAAINDRVPKVVHASIPSMCSAGWYNVVFVLKGIIYRAPLHRLSAVTELRPNGGEKLVTTSVDLMSHQ